MANELNNNQHVSQEPQISKCPFESSPSQSGMPSGGNFGDSRLTTAQGKSPQQGQPNSVPTVSTISAANVPRGASDRGTSAKGNASGVNTKRTILIVLGVVLIAIVIWVLVWLFACNGQSMFDPNAQTGQAPYKTQEEMQAELDRTVEEGMFNISIASVIQFENGTSSGTAYIENVPGNHYLMQVTITDDDTGDVLYESGVLKPNQFVENITLTKDLEPGNYDATATFKALDETTYEEVGQAAAKVTLNVLG